MPNITKEELDRLNALFGDLVKAASVIKIKAPNVKGTCEEIERHGQTASSLLREVQERGFN
jgi:hypothetical protein